jgi:hypothetical protein
MLNVILFIVCRCIYKLVIFVLSCNTYMNIMCVSTIECFVMLFLVASAENAIECGLPLLVTVKLEG